MCSERRPAASGSSPAEWWQRPGDGGVGARQLAGAEGEDPATAGVCRLAPPRDRQKPAALVARRNARERRRVHAVNCAFGRLRRAVPLDNARGKRVSKVKTLQRAIEYIQQLQRLLLQAAGAAARQPDHQISLSSDRKKENLREVSNRWTNYDATCGPDSIALLLSEFQDY